MISSLVLILQILCLSWWIGGSAVLLFLVLPSFGAQPSGRPDTPSIVESALRRFRSWLLADLLALGIMLLGQLAFLSPSVGVRLRIALTLVTAAAFVEAYTRLARWSEHEDGRGTVADRKTPVSHRRSRQFLTLNFFLGIAVVITLIIP